MLSMRSSKRSMTTSTPPKSLAAVFEYVRETNTAMDEGRFPKDNVSGAIDLLERVDSIFDVY